MGRGPFIGGLIGASFGLVFVLVNSGGLGIWTWFVRGAAVLATLVITVDLVRRSGPPSRRGVDAGSSTPFGRGYWFIVLAETLALFAGVQVIVRAFDAPRYAITWVVFVVGVHFFGLGYLWTLTRFYVLGTALVALAATAMIAGWAGASDSALRVTAGVGAGVTLLMFAATTGRAIRVRPASKPGTVARSLR